MERRNARQRRELNRRGNEEAAATGRRKAHRWWRASQANGSSANEPSRSGAQRLDGLTARRSTAARSASVGLTSSGVTLKHATGLAWTKAGDAERTE